jgi:transcriptional regulator with XRE-family HTH domain
MTGNKTRKQYPVDFRKKRYAAPFTETIHKENMKGNKLNNDTSINNRLLEIRKAKGLSQGEFADRIKISRSMVGSIEEGRREAKDRLISLICLTFGVNEYWIRSGKGSMFDNPKNERLERLVYVFNTLDENSQNFVLQHLDLLIEYRRKEGKA